MLVSVAGSCKMWWPYSTVNWLMTCSSVPWFLPSQRFCGSVSIILACCAHPVARLKDVGLFGTSAIEQVSVSPWMMTLCVCLSSYITWRCWYFVIDAHKVRTKNSLCITLNVLWIFLCNLIDMYVASVELWTLLLKWNLVKWIFLHISWIYNDMLCWIPGPDRAMDWLLSLGDWC
jgi:hypothetical protein